MVVDFVEAKIEICAPASLFAKIPRILEYCGGRSKKYISTIHCIVLLSTRVCTKEYIE